MRIAIASDAWTPQVNGVVRTLQTTVEHLRARGHRVTMVTPDLFPSVPCPGYGEIRLALPAPGAMGRRLAASGCDAVHIATEGPIGWAARRWCLRTGRPFTTSFHTRFPDYLALRTGLSPDRFWPIVRRFHASAETVLVATDGLADELASRGMAHTTRWSRGVDVTLFRPDGQALAAAADLPRPIHLSVGRLAVEKNLGEFLALDLPGSVIVVGDGPQRRELEARYPRARFTGALAGAALASAYRTADVLVFPSRTDTFGLVVIEALASGTPVAALPAPGPADILGGALETVGCCDADLRTAIDRALTCDPAACRREALRYSWESCTDQFLGALVAPRSADKPLLAA